MASMQQHREGRAAVDRGEEHGLQMKPRSVLWRYFDKGLSLTPQRSTLCSTQRHNLMPKSHATYVKDTTHTIARQRP